MHASYADRYRTLWERHWWWRSRERFVLGWLRNLTRDAEVRPRLLDVGCGDGLFFERLESLGDVSGIESDPALVRDPRWKGRIHVGSIADAATSSYDVVLMLDVLEHIADDRAALVEVRRALRPGGRLLLTVPALMWLWSGHDVVNEHHRRYHRSDLRAVLTDAGFTVETVRYFFVWTIGPMLARRLLIPAGSAELACDRGVAIPWEPVNRFLTAWSAAEHTLGRFARWPLGSSLLAVARA